MASTIVTPQIDIAEIVFNSLSPTLPENTRELEAALDLIDDRLTSTEYDAVWAAAMAAMCYAQEAAFKLGWELRSKV